MSGAAPKHYRKRNAQALYDTHVGPNMTPMVDVVMVILIFFMASAAMLGPEWFVRTNLPRAGGVSNPNHDEQPTRLTLNIERDADESLVRITPSGPVLSMRDVEQSLRAALKEQAADRIIVIVEPGEDVPYEDVVALHAICQRLGIENVGLGRPARSQQAPAP